MNLKEAIRNGFRDKVEKQNPWMPYRGEAGGQGWQNMLTGEIRYQDARPAPGEGMPDGFEGDVPTPEEDPGDELDALTEEDLLSEHLEEGDEVTFDLTDISGDEVTHENVEGEVTLVTDGDSFGPKVQYEHPESGYTEDHQIEWDQLDTFPYELEPSEGWAEGWTGAPDSTDDIFVGDTVEIYDRDAGQYHQAEVTTTSGGDYLMAETEDGEEIEVLIDDPETNGNVLTAVEDHVSQFGDELIDISE